jgi:hypothetical protein
MMALHGSCQQAQNTAELALTVFSGRLGAGGLPSRLTKTVFATPRFAAAGFGKLARA